MANNVNLMLTNYGLNKVMSNGAEQTFKYFSLSDMNEIYYVTSNPNLSDIGNITGSKSLFTARKACNDTVPTSAQVNPPTDTNMLKTAQRWVVNYYKSNCGVNDYTKSNLDLTINLHEYFNWLTDTSTSDYTENLMTSLQLIQGLYLVKQEQNFVDKTWSNIDTTSRFAASYEFINEQDKNNYLKFSSKYINYKGEQQEQIDKSFDRFYSSLLLGFGTNIEGNNYLEGHNSYLTFGSPQFGYVVNGITNFIPLNKMGETKSYDEIRPAVILGSTTIRDLYYLKEPNMFKTTDLNRFMGQAIWGYINSENQPLILGMVEKAKNNIEFYFKETSFNRWELPINLRLKISNDENLSIIGGDIKYNFVYEPNATLLGYNNIIKVN